MITLRKMKLPHGGFFQCLNQKRRIGPMQYYGNRLSENISRREPEGYLLCLNVPVARTGTQDYLPRI